MAAAKSQQEKARGAGFGALWRFLPMLWPQGRLELRMQVIAALALVLAGKAAVLLMPFAYKAVVDGMSASRQPFGVVAMLVVGYAAARFAGVLSDNLRNALFEKVGQEAARRLAGMVFRHIHDLSLRFHLERRTGSLTRIVERGTKSIDMMLYFLLFNIGPTLVELTAACIIFFVKFGLGLVAATLAMMAFYILFTRRVTEWRAELQRHLNDVDNKAIGRAVNSLLNYETVKYFNAEERETRRYDEAIAAFARATVRNEVSLAWLNIGQAFDHQPDDGGRDGLHRMGLEPRPVHRRRCRLRQHDAAPAFQAARHAGLGLSLDPPGADRHGSDVAPRRHAG